MPSEPAGRDRLLYQLAAELTSSLDLDHVLTRVMDRVVDLMHAGRGFIVLVDAGGRMSVRVSRGETEDDRSAEFLGSRTVIERVMAEGVPVLAADAAVDERFRGRESVMLHNLRSILAVPLKARGRQIGAVYVDNPFRAGIFGEPERDFLQAIADVASIAIDNALTFQHAELMRKTFERYVNRAVTDWVLMDPTRDRVFLPGRRLRVTMLASDIAGFSTLSRKMEAEALVDFLNGYFRRMVDIVLGHGGNVDKFQGDGLLVAFGAPEPQPDSAQRALAAAREMRAEIARMNDERRAAGGAAIEVGIGLDTGWVVAGNVGSERRLEYTLIGVPVNNAAFLSKQRPAAVLLSRGTHRALGGGADVEERPPIVLKGASRGVPVYALR